MSEPIPKGKDVHLSSMMLIFNQKTNLHWFTLSLQKGSKFFLFMRGNTSKNEIRAGYAEAGILIRVISISRKKPKTSVSGVFAGPSIFTGNEVSRLLSPPSGNQYRGIYSGRNKNLAQMFPFMVLFFLLMGWEQITDNSVNLYFQSEAAIDILKLSFDPMFYLFLSILQ